MCIPRISQVGDIDTLSTKHPQKHETIRSEGESGHRPCACSYATLQDKSEVLQLILGGQQR